MIPRHTRALAPWLLFSAACIADLDTKSIIKHLRVLDIVAEPPEVSPGGVVTVHAMVAGNHETPRYQWTACVSADPTSLALGTSTFGATQGENGCATDAAVGTVSLGTDPTAHLPVPADLLAHLDLLAARFGGQVPVSTLQQLARDVGLVVGIGLVVQADGYTVQAYKRVVVSTNPHPNHNPPSPRLTVGGTSVVASADDPEVCVPAGGGMAAAVRPGATVALVPDPNESWLETYRVLLATGQLADRTELAFYSWYATDGSFSQQLTRTPIRDDQWIAPLTAGPQTMWLLVRDGHGGTSGCRFLLNVDPAAR